MKKIFLFVILPGTLCLPFSSFAQEGRNIDSIKQILKRIPASDKVKKAKELISLGQQYIFKSNYTAAMDSYQQSLAIAQNINNDSLEAGCYVGLGVIAYYQGDLYKDSIYNFKALKIFKEEHDTLREGKTLRNIAATFAQKGDLSNANKYFERASLIFIKLHQLKMAAGIYSNMAAMYRWDFRKSIELELSAKKIWDEDPNDGVLPAANLGNLGIHYFYLVKFDSLKSVKHDSIISADPSENLKKAETYLKQAIEMAMQNNDINNQSHYIGELAELQAYKADYKNAYYNIRKYFETQDSIFSQANKNKLAAIETQNEIDKKSLEIEKEKTQVHEQKKNTFLSLAGLLIVAVIGFLYYRLSAIRRQKNKELTELNSELDKANKLKAKFFGILSHDLRSPVANLVSFLNLRKIDPGALTIEETERSENKIGASAQALLETIESMLLWSKSQMQQFRAEKKSVKVDDLFCYLKKMFADNKNLTLTFSDEDEIYTETDENFLKTIMYNLTANAVKALAKRTDGRIEWKAWSENDKLFLSISDNGPGIREEKLRALYDETVSSGSAHGLGLHIIRDLAKAINCHITVKPVAGTGAEFVLVL
jgi:signal transduction histidine kinase